MKKNKGIFNDFEVSEQSFKKFSSKLNHSI